MTNQIETRRLGSTGPTVGAVGIGCNGMSGTYGAADDEQSVATIRAALDSGVTLLDTADFYGSGHNELLIARALAGRRREDAVVSVKFGGLRGPGGGWGGNDTRPEAVRNFLAYSLVRLGLDHVDIYRPARLDPAVPIEDTVGAIGELIEAGYVRHIGLSEVGADTIRRAVAVHPVSDLQIEYSLLSRDIEDEILPTCRELGIGVTAYGVLSRGLISGTGQRDFPANDFRAHSPRFQGENLDRNLGLVAALQTVADRIAITVPQLAVAWVASRGDDIVPLVGTRRADRLREAVGALDVELDNDALTEIEAAVPRGAAAGERYPAAQIAQLDSER